MKIALTVLIISVVLSSCNFGFGPLEAEYDNLNYESITNAKGKVIVKFGDTPIIYEHATIVYSESDATTMLIKTNEGKYVYIQGQAIVELEDLNAND